MPAPATIDDFLSLGLRSGLLERSTIAACQNRWQANGIEPQNAQEIGDALIRDNLLTRFQAEKLLTGRWRGFIIAGKYRLMERLGAGGMGAVYLCEHILMGRKIALKVLPLAQAEDAASLARFYREARAVARLDHPNIVRAHDIGHENKLHFLVLEFVDGCNLHDFVRRNGTLAPNRAANYIRQAALGLQHAHESGLVHRDIKPGNLLLDRQGVVKVLDMGLARFFHEDTNAFIKEFEIGFIIGTADYVAPEQIVDSRVDIRADIYSLGGTFYYLLVGKSPFQDGSNSQKMIWHQVRMPKSLRALRPDVPAGLVQIVDKMMAKDPEKRYQTPAEVAAALSEYCGSPVLAPLPDEMPPSILSLCQRPLSQISQTTIPFAQGTTESAPGVAAALTGTPTPRVQASIPSSRALQ